MIIRDASDWRPMSYEQAVHWIIQCKDTAWLDANKPSAQALVIADLFKKSHETLRQDVKAVLEASRGTL